MVLWSAVGEVVVWSTVSGSVLCYRVQLQLYVVDSISTHYIEHSFNVNVTVCSTSLYFHLSSISFIVSFVCII